MKKKKEKKGLWWITMTNNSHFKTLKIKSVNGSDKSKEKDFSNCIYFDNEDEANKFLKKIKGFIRRNYDKAVKEKKEKGKDWFKNK